MTAVFANAIAVAIGSVIGLAFKKAIPDSWGDIIMKGIGLVSICIGINGFLEGENTIILIISMVLGAVIGESLKIEERFNGFASRVEERLDKNGGKSNFAQGFISSSLLFCVGAMTVIGALEAGLRGNTSLLYTKTVMDGISSVMFASTLGIGVFFAVIPIIVIEGGIALLASYIEPFLSTGVVNEMTAVGSVLILALGFNLSMDKDFKILNYMPAILLPVVVCPLYDYIGALF